MSERQPPIVKPAKAQPQDPGHQAAVIFMHGFADDALGFSDMADQFQSVEKLSHVKWILPNAVFNRDSLEQAWYTPTSLPARAPPRPELEDDEDKDGLLASREYIVNVIDDLVASGVPASRIVLGGFSQGHAMSLLTGLTSKYAGQLAGLACLLGYLPLANEIPTLRADANLPAEAGRVPIFLARGMKDTLVPRRFFVLGQEKLKELGVPDDSVEAHEYEGLPHTINARVMGDFAAWLEKVIPGLA